MAGHSHSSNIWSTKTAQDSKRAKVFTRISKDIYNAVKIGKSSDPNLNPLLRSAIERAKAVNIPQDRVIKAIEKASGKSDGKDAIQEKIYEVLALNKVFLLVESETDNPTRTIAEVKLIVNRSDFKMLEVGSALRFFEEVGEISASLNHIVDIEKFLDKIISLNGIIDYLSEDLEFVIQVEKDNFRDCVQEISNIENIKLNSAKIVYRNRNRVTLSEEELGMISDFKEKLLNLDDVINVWF